MAREWIAVALGGMLGALMRHALSWLFSLLGPLWLPIATLAANIIGCFAIGALAQWSLQTSLTREWWVVGVRVGVLGGLTTFSAFALDVVRLWNEQRNVPSVGLVVSHVALGIAAVVLGVACVRAYSSAELTD